MRTGMKVFDVLSIFAESGQFSVGGRQRGFGCGGAWPEAPACSGAMRRRGQPAGRVDDRDNRNGALSGTALVH